MIRKAAEGDERGRNPSDALLMNHLAGKFSKAKAVTLSNTVHVEPGTKHMH